MLDLFKGVPAELNRRRPRLGIDSGPFRGPDGFIAKHQGEVSVYTIFEVFAMENIVDRFFSFRKP